MINQYGKIDIPVGYTFYDGENTYRAIMPFNCDVCVFNHIHFCDSVACVESERLDGRGVHFIKEGKEARNDQERSNKK